MKKVAFEIIFCMIFCVGFAACKTTKQTSFKEITNKEWQLTEVFGEKINDSTNYRKQPFIYFKSDDNKIIGNGGCNSLNGSFSLTGKNKIEISNLITTRMACIGVDVEKNLLKALKLTKSYFLKNNSLHLSNEQGEIIAQFTLKKKTDNEQ